MIVIFVIALCVTHVLKYGKSAYVSEGFEDGVEKDTDSKKKDKTDDKKEEKVELSELKEEYKDFQGIQEKIINNMKEINPLLDKAESFIQKFESYKKNQKTETMKNKEKPTNK